MFSTTRPNIALYDVPMWLKICRSSTAATHLTDGLRLHVERSTAGACDERLVLSGQLSIGHSGVDTVVVTDVAVQHNDGGDGVRQRIVPRSIILQASGGTLSCVEVPFSLNPGDSVTAIYDSPVRAVARRSGKTCLSARAVVAVAGRHSLMRGRRMRLEMPNWQRATPGDQPSLDFAIRALRAQLMSPC